jgi:hypothetical protein
MFLTHTTAIHGITHDQRVPFNFYPGKSILGNLNNFLRDKAFVLVMGGIPFGDKLTLLVKLPAQRAGLLKNLIKLVGGICPPNPLTRIPFIPVQSTGFSGMG